MEELPRESSRAGWKAWIVPAILAVLLALWLSPAGRRFDVALAAEWLRSVGQEWWAPLLFILLYTAFNLALIPGTILSLTAGVIWGWILGGFWVVIASGIGSVAPYLVARAGSGPIARWMETRSGRLRHILEDEGFTTLLLLRLVPIVPYNVLNYAAGLAGIRPRDYVLATVIGTLPGIFIFTFLADAIASGLVSPRDAFLRILLAGVLLGGLILITRLVSGRVRGRLRR